MASQKKGPLYGLPDRFVAVEIETEATPAFDAAQYSFFGDLSAADSGLEGALEDGLEAPPAEEGLGGQEYGLHGADDEALPIDDEEDLSVAALFRNQLGLGPAKTPTKRVDPDVDAALDALLMDPLSVARTQLQDEDYDQHLRDLPAELYPAPLSSSQTALSGQPHPLFVPPADASSSPYNLFDPYAQSPRDDQPAAVPPAAAAPSTGNQPAASSAPPAPSPPMPPPASAGTSLLQMLKKPAQQPKAMTLEELEARMLGNAEAAASAAAAAAAVPGAAGGALPGGPTSAEHPMAPPGSAGAPDGGPGHVLLLSPQYPQAPPPGGPHSPPPHGRGMLPLPYSPHMPPHMQPPPPHGMYGLGGPPPPPMMGMAGPPGPYPTPPMPPPGAFPPQHPQSQHMMYNNNGGLMPPLGHHLMPPMHLPPGGMAPGFGPGPMGPRPRQPGPPLGMPGHGPFPQDSSFQMRPGAHPSGPGMPPVPLHGPGPRPPPGYGPGPGTGHAAPPPPPPAAPPLQRPPGFPGMMVPPQQQQAPPRPPYGNLGGGPLAAPRLLQARGPPNGPAPPSAGNTVPDFGQQFARGSAGPAQQTAVALAAAAAAAGRAGGVLSGPGGRLRGKYMTPENIEYVVRSLLHNVASGVPYVEDYYYQAFVHKHVSAPSRQQLSPGAFPMAALFVPQALRTPTADQMRVMRLDPSQTVKFVEGLEGLGKIVLSNIRTPKVLMDLSERGAAGASGAKLLTAAADGGDGTVAGNAKASDDAAARSTRPLEQEPLLAARIMIEDCMNLMLDLDDIDRLAAHLAAVAQAQQRAAAAVAAAGAAAAAAGGGSGAAGAYTVGPYGPDSEAPPSPAELRQRRDLLLAGINGAFRLPDAPQGAVVRADRDGVIDEEDDSAAEGGSRGPGDGSLGDGVLLRILAISKGRNLVARALLAVAPPGCFAALTPKPAARPAASAAALPPPQQQSKKDSAPVEGSAVSAAAKEDAPAAGASEPGAAAAAGADVVQTADSIGGGGLAAAASSSSAGGPPVGSGPDSADSGPSPFVLLWGTLRNAWMLFGSSLQQGLDAGTERPMLEATARLAAALRDALLRLPTARDVVDAAVAFNAGCQRHVEAQCQGNPGAAGSMELTLLPLAQTRAVETGAVGAGALAPPAWLGETLAALVMRASQLGLGLAAAAAADEEDGADGSGKDAAGEPAGAPPPGPGQQAEKAAAAAPSGSPPSPASGPSTKDSVEAAWSREFGRLHDRLARHLTALGGIHSMAVASANAEALAVVRAMCCRQLVNAMLPLATSGQARQLREALAAFAA